MLGLANLSPCGRRAFPGSVAGNSVRRVAGVPGAHQRTTVTARRVVTSADSGRYAQPPIRVVRSQSGLGGGRRARARVFSTADELGVRRLAAGGSDDGVPDAEENGETEFVLRDDDDDGSHEVAPFSDGLNDPFAGLASVSSGADVIGFDAMLDDIVGGVSVGNGDGANDDDDDAGAGTGTGGVFSRPGDDQPWPASGNWAEFDTFLVKLAGMGYSLESPNAPAGWDDENAGDGGSSKMSTPEWARAVASEDEKSDESDDTSDEPGVRLPGLDDDPFAHVAHDDSSTGEDLTYSNKKRLLLEFSRDRDDAFDRLSERELYQLADHPMPHNQGNSGGRKQVNALKRLRAHLGIDDADLRGKCAAADHQQPAMGAVKLSDVLRVVHVYAEDVTPTDRPSRAMMQSLLRRLTLLADSPRQTASQTRGGGNDAKAKQPRWVERRERNSKRPEFEDDNYAPTRSFDGGRGRGGRSFGRNEFGRGGNGGGGGRGGYGGGRGSFDQTRDSPRERNSVDLRVERDSYRGGGGGTRRYEESDGDYRSGKKSFDDEFSVPVARNGYGRGRGDAGGGFRGGRDGGRGGRGGSSFDRDDDRRAPRSFDRNAFGSDDGWDTRPPPRQREGIERSRDSGGFDDRRGGDKNARSGFDRDARGGFDRGDRGGFDGGRGRGRGRGGGFERGRGGGGGGGFAREGNERRTRSQGGFGADRDGEGFDDGEESRGAEKRFESRGGRGYGDGGGRGYGDGGSRSAARGGGRGSFGGYEDREERGGFSGAVRGRGERRGGGRAGFPNDDREGGFSGARGRGGGGRGRGDRGGFDRGDRNGFDDRENRPERGSRFDREFTPRGGGRSGGRGRGGTSQVRLWRPKDVGDDGGSVKQPDRSNFGGGDWE
jgi:transcription initiation factor TFIID subunit 15